ncbi:MAG: phosphoribosylformylglycinamidine synthase subunit PurQ, partial [Bacteroidales bacterium]|nr:phosphoribosylformylglycinamidine synthase subunit PurQ [Bacteroidales bacterium]
TTLSAKEIIGNESQERMGLVLKKEDYNLLNNIAERERAPIYAVGKITDDKIFKIEDKKNEPPIDLKLEYLFGKPPKTVIIDRTVENNFERISYNKSSVYEYLKNVLQLEAVACKDWLTNKVDRSVTGKVAKQQCAGTVQLPLNNLGVVALDYKGVKGIATSIGHAPVSALVNPANGSVLSIAEALTNIIWAPIEDGLKGISLSANWMWPSKNNGEDARLYEAVRAVSDFACELGINIPTGKDSLSMTQKYSNGNVVFAPGTVIISAAAEVKNIKKIISPVLINDLDTSLIYIDFSKDKFNLGGSSFSQVVNELGKTTPTVKDAEYFKKTFNVIQELITRNKIIAGHDISAGGIITTLLEMTFGSNKTGLDIDFSELDENDIIKLLFSENPGIIIQVKDKDFVNEFLKTNNIDYFVIGKPCSERVIKLKYDSEKYNFDINELRDVWFKTSYLFDKKQCGEKLALERFKNYKNQELKYKFNRDFSGKLSQYNIDFNRRKPTGIKAAIIREKGVNGDREMAYSMHLAGFDVKDVHMTDLISGRETLEDINFIVFVGGFSNSDVLGSAKGW